jgi:hypothetical protein
MRAPDAPPLCDGNPDLGISVITPRPRLFRVGPASRCNSYMMQRVRSALGVEGSALFGCRLRAWIFPRCEETNNDQSK